MFDLLGGRAVEASDAEWATAAAIASDHRLEPWLHDVWGGDEAVPAALSQRWAAAYRDAALSALAHERSLLRIADLLEVQAIVLKGSWLARSVYDQTALRPVRDIDLLLAPDEVVAAWKALQAKGFTQAEPLELAPAEWARRYKHMPALRDPDGVVVELHARLWDDGLGAPDYPADLFERAVADPRHPALLALHTSDILMHGAVHGVWAHRWDNGPLGLIDLALMCERLDPDWREVWQRGEEHGWDRMLAAQIAATDRWLKPGLLTRARCPINVPPALVKDAARMMTAPSSMREHDRSARRLTASPRGRTKALGTRLRRLREPGKAARWFIEQAQGWWAVRRNRDGAARLGANRELEDWLTG